MTNVINATVRMASGIKTARKTVSALSLRFGYLTPERDEDRCEEQADGDADTDVEIDAHTLPADAVDPRCRNSRLKVAPGSGVHLAKIGKLTGKVCGTTSSSIQLSHYII